MFPTAKSNSDFFALIMVTTISGRDVANATVVRAKNSTLIASKIPSVSIEQTTPFAEIFKIISEIIVIVDNKNVDLFSMKSISFSVTSSSMIFFDDFFTVVYRYSINNAKNVIPYINESFPMSMIYTSENVAMLRKNKSQIFIFVLKFFENNINRANTNNMFEMLLPITVPKINAEGFVEVNIAIIAVINSGRDVPIATIVIPIINLDSPSLSPISEDEDIRQSADFIRK